MTQFTFPPDDNHADRPPLALTKHFSQGFDYGVVNADQREAVQAHALAIHAIAGEISLRAVEVGGRLCAVHEALGAKLFGVWRAAEFRWSQTTTDRLMRIFRRFGEVEPAVLGRFDMTALFELCCQRVSDAARQEAIDLAASGQKVSQAVAFGISERHEPRERQPRGNQSPPAKPGPTAAAAASRPPHSAPSADAADQPATLQQRRELSRIQCDVRAIIKRHSAKADRIAAARRVVAGVRATLAEFDLDYLLDGAEPKPARRLTVGAARRIQEAGVAI